MAIWQYKIFLLPEDVVTDYFKNSTNLSDVDFDSILWWQNHQLEIDDFNMFYTILSRSKSWSEDIYMIGEIDSTCIEIFFDGAEIEEVSVRIDLRYDYAPFVKLLCNFAVRYSCVFLDTKFNLIAASEILLLKSIDNHSDYKKFIDKLKD